MHSNLTNLTIYLELARREASTGIWLQADLRHKIRGLSADTGPQHPKDRALEDHIHAISQDLGGFGDAYSLRGGQSRELQPVRACVSPVGHIIIDVSMLNSGWLA